MISPCLFHTNSLSGSSRRRLLRSGFVIFKCFLIGASLIFLSGSMSKIIIKKKKSAEMLVSKKEKKELTYFFLSISLAATSSTLPIFPESQTESKTAAPTTLTHAGVGTEPRSCPVWLHAWLRGLHHPYKVARLRSERPRRHTSGDESGSLYTPPPRPTPPVALMYWSCLIPVRLPSLDHRWGFHHTNLSHDPTVWF